MKKWKTTLIVSVLALVIVVGFGLTIASDAGLMLFNALLGNEVRCLVVSYSVGSLNSFVILNVSITTTTSKVPVETAIFGYKTIENGLATVSDFGITLTLTVRVLNGQVIYWRTMTFRDSKPRTIICYLNNYNAQDFPVFTTYVDGNYLFNGVQTPFNYGSQLRVDA